MELLLVAIVLTFMIIDSIVMEIKIKKPMLEIMKENDDLKRENTMLKRIVYNQTKG